MSRYLCLLVVVVLALWGCSGSSEKPIDNLAAHGSNVACCGKPEDSTVVAGVNDSEIVTGEVPIISYHQIRDWTPKDNKSERVYIVPVAAFRAEMRLLHEQGYHSILPDQYLAHLQQGAPLPTRPVMITFDDGDGSQYTAALPELNKAGYKAVFFVMTVILNRPGYFSKAQVKELVDNGHVIGCHTWDHHMVTKYNDADWVKQVEKPRAELAEITGSPIKYFAYPYGVWNIAAADRLKKYGFTAAFMLAGKSDHDLPLFTVRRQIVDGNWTAERLLKTIEIRQKEKSRPIASLSFTYEQ